MRPLRALWPLVALIFLGCATPYQPSGFRGGYSETILAENVFQVRFKGNGYTSGERASDYALLRAAEVALGHGYRYFALAETDQQTSLGSYTTPSQSHTTGYVYGNQVNLNTRTTGGQTYVFQKPSTTNTIICFMEKPEDGGLVLDAEFVARSIREKYGLE